MNDEEYLQAKDEEHLPADDEKHLPAKDKEHLQAKDEEHLPVKDEQHLPVFGIGPILVFPMLLLSIITLILSACSMIPALRIDGLSLPLTILGTALVLAGIGIWISAVVKSRITAEILDNKLVTSGIYSYIRHPIYSAFLLASSGLIFASQNLLLFPLPIIYWIVLTIGMIKTEEKWLLEKFGDEYREYSERVNRFIPFFRI